MVSARQIRLPLGTQNANVATVAVLLALAGAFGLVATHDRLGLAGSVQISESGRRVGAVRVEERPTHERSAIDGVEGIGLLTQ